MKQDQNWLAEMESRRRDDEPSPGQEMAALMRRTDEVLKGLSPEDGAELRGLSAGWRELVLAGYALSWRLCAPYCRWRRGTAHRRPGGGCLAGGEPAPDPCRRSPGRHRAGSPAPQRPLGRPLHPGTGAGPAAVSCSPPPRRGQPGGRRTCA